MSPVADVEEEGIQSLQMCVNRVQSIISSVENDELNSSNGISLLEVKNQTLLSYLIDYSYLLLIQSLSKPIENHPIIDQLIIARVYLEKLKPLESKIRYQIDKLIKQTSDQQSGTLEESHVLTFKANPQNFDTETGINDNHEKQDETSISNTIYKPPKLAPAYFQETPRDKDQRVDKKQLERLSKSRLLRELKEQYDDRPEEQTTYGTGHSSKHVSNELGTKWNQRKEFEEENFVRLSMTRQDKRTQKILQKQSTSMQFQNEFTNLDQDFKNISNISESIDKASKHDGILSKTVKRKEMSDGGKDMDKMMNSLSQSSKKIIRNKDDFGKEMKKLKKSRK